MEQMTSCAAAYQFAEALNNGIRAPKGVFAIAVLWDKKRKEEIRGSLFATRDDFEEFSNGDGRKVKIKVLWQKPDKQKGSPRR